jgi:hypothetical protein
VKDQVFKEFLQAFLPEFIALFFPDVARELNFDTLQFLDKELFTDVGEGEQREADIVARVETNQGVPEFLLIHTEVESTRRPSQFPHRMLNYYILLWLRHKTPIVPIFLYLAPGAGGLITETVEHVVLGKRVLSFAYDAIGLPDLSADDYTGRSNPIAETLSVWMRSDQERLDRWMSLLHNLKQENINPARQALLLNVAEIGLPLSTLEEEDLIAQLRTDTEIETMTNFITRDAFREGKREGIAEGKDEERLEMLLDATELKFGTVSNEMKNYLQQVILKEEGKAILARILRAEKPEDIFLKA